MRTEKSNLVRFIYGAFAVWGSLFLFIFSFGTNEAFQVLRGFWPLLSLPVGVAFVILSVVALFKEQRKVHPLLTLSLAVLSLVFFLKIWQMGSVIGFYLHKGRYESIVRQVIAVKSEEERKQICYGDCWIYSNSDEPAQVAFHYAHGFLNWHDFIYDKTGAMAAPNPPYTGYFVASERLTGDWYFCHFAD